MTQRSFPISVLGAALLVGGCGARTGLSELGFDAGRDASVERVDAGADSGRDAGLDAGFDAGVDAGPECRPFRATARLAALDVFVLLDSSGSMDDRTSAGVTKAEAVAAALGGFVSSPESAGIGVALTFFPEIDEDVPRFCARDDECGAGGVCEAPDLCYPSGDQFCRTSMDCRTEGDRCVRLGYCSGREDQGCLPGISAGCSVGSTCTDYGFCTNRLSCMPRDYAPTVPIGPLPDVAMAFVDALEAREPEGGTSTATALEGTLRRARSRRVASPGSKVIILLATDGFPTDCDPAIDRYGPRDGTRGIPLVVEIVGDAAATGIDTFVVGVFDEEEEPEARANLSAIASAGGTGEALVVTTAEPVTARLLAIFEDLRRTVRSCIYAIPHAGVLPVPEELRVSMQAPRSEPVPLERRADGSACDAASGGFFFEPVEEGTRPGFVELCPTSCTVAARPEVDLVMQVDCPEP